MHYQLTQLSKRAFSWLPPSIKLGRTYRQHLAMAQREQYWLPYLIREWQTIRFLELLRHAWTHCEGYRELYQQAGLTLDDIQNLDDLRYLPTVTKEMLRDNIAAFSVPIKKHSYVTTGGSSGVPFGFYLGRDNRMIELAYMHASWMRAGWRPGHSVILRGSFVGSAEAPWQYDAWRKRLNVTASYLTPETLPGFLAMVNHYKPQTLQAYPSACLILADLLQDYGKPVDLPFKWIMLGSENLYDWQVEKFSEAFPQARLFSWYGHSEKAILAPWCEHNRTYHAWPTYGITEVLNEQGHDVSEGEEGQVVVTGLHMWATPFIRYETADIAVKGPQQCPDCRRHGQVLSRIMGRLQEVIVTSTGRYVSMTAMNMHSPVFDGIRQFQFYQDHPGVVGFRFIAKRSLCWDELNRIRKELEAKLGHDVDLGIERVQEIPYTRGGKRCFLEQRLPIRYGDHTLSSERI